MGCLDYIRGAGTHIAYESNNAFIILTSIHKSQHIHTGRFGYNANILSLHLLKLH